MHLAVEARREPEAALVRVWLPGNLPVDWIGTGDATLKQVARRRCVFPELRSAIEVAHEMERELRRPVITNDTAVFWQSLRISGIPDRIQGFGQLLEQHLALGFACAGNVISPVACLSDSV
jgi:hypothetical protein